MTNVHLTDKGLWPEGQKLVNYWKNYLKDRGIPVGWADKSGVRVDLADGGLVFSYFDHKGKQSGFYRWRQFETLPKFLQEPDTGVCAYMPPVKNHKLSMSEILADPEQPLIIAEGETRALALNAVGLPTIAIGGINSYGKDGQLCPDLAKINWQGRDVTYTFDSDVSRRPELQTSVLKLAGLLADLGVSMKLLPIPDQGDGNTGADDYLTKHGKREFTKLLKQAKDFRHPDFASWGRDGIKLDLTLSPVGINWLTKKPPELQFTWEQYLPRKSVALLVAEGGTGKTYFAQALAQSVAGGIPFLNLPTRQGIAVHIAFEEVPDELRRRQYAIFKNVRDKMEDRQGTKFVTNLSKYFYLKSVVGQELHLAVMDGSNVVQGKKALDALIYQLKQLGDVELVVIDPLSRAHSIDGETQAWGTTIINACERIALEVGCTVLLTHHTGKGKAREDQYSPRGASALSDAARVVLRLKEASLEDIKHIGNITEDDVYKHRILKLINPKLSYGPRVPDTWLYREQDGVLIPFDVKDSGTGTFKSQLDQVFKFVKATNQQPFSRTLIRNSRKEIFDDKTISYRDVGKVIDQALRYGSLIPSRQKKGGAALLQFSEGYQLGGEK